jgi:hypothetical protein
MNTQISSSKLAWTRRTVSIATQRRRSLPLASTPQVLSARFLQTLIRRSVALVEPNFDFTGHRSVPLVFRLAKLSYFLSQNG